MKKTYSLGKMIAAVVVTAVIIFDISCIGLWYLFTSRYGASVQAREYGKLDEIMAYIDTYYIRDDYDESALIDAAAAGLVSALPDGWSYYMDADAYLEMTDSSVDDYVGIGVTAVYDETAGIQISKVYADSPAQKAGLRFFDIITEIDGTAVLELGSDTSFQAVKGKEGTTVHLTVYRPSTDEVLEFDVLRATIENKAVESQMLDGNIGYIHLESFSTGADTQFLTALKDLQEQGATSFLFDVRFNPGGRLDVLKNILDPLLPEGTIISWVDKEGNTGSMTSDADCITCPMVVLAHEYSYSAAEFFAAALQEYGVAQVVGMNTTGKCYAQNTFPLSDGSAVSISTMTYTTPSGKSLGGVGIQPDYEIPLSYEQLANFDLLPFEEDPQMQKALELLQNP